MINYLWFCWHLPRVRKCRWCWQWKRGRRLCPCLPIRSRSRECHRSFSSRGWGSPCCGWRSCRWCPRWLCRRYRILRERFAEKRGLKKVLSLWKALKTHLLRLEGFVSLHVISIQLESAGPGLDDVPHLQCESSWHIQGFEQSFLQLDGESHFGESRREGECGRRTIAAGILSFLNIGDLASKLGFITRKSRPQKVALTSKLSCERLGTWSFSVNR